MFAEAKPIYEQLGGDPAVSIMMIDGHFFKTFQKTSSVSVLMRTASCLRNLDELQEAAEVYEQSSLSPFFSTPVLTELGSSPSRGSYEQRGQNETRRNL